MHVCDRISRASLWPKLEQAAIQTALSGGLAGMGYYRDAWASQRSLKPGQPNASTEADIQATVSILRAGHNLLAPIAGALMCGLSYFGEETGYDTLLRAHLTDDVLRHKHPAATFFENHDNVLRVIFDGIDGTRNFDRAIPLFCSAVAILTDDQVRVAAIYDPIHHEVCSAVLPGPYEARERDATAFAWQVATGSRIDLVQQARAHRGLPLDQEAVGIHLTRNRKKRKELKAFTRPASGAAASALERLATRTQGLYALNSGLMAMTLVARGGLGAFVNTVTNPWDVAAGEVLVRACGGRVTDLFGRPIRYLSGQPLSVVAAKARLHRPLLKLLAPAARQLRGSAVLPGPRS